ncbi:MAG: carbonic anhydrase family protein [bacterium]
MKKVIAILTLALGAAACGAQEHAETVNVAQATATPAKVTETLTKESQAALTPDSVIARLKEGNERFVSGNMINRDLPAQVDATASGQYPSAIVLSCVDSRAPAELLFDQGIGDIFNARVAGNFINDDMLGSMEFATKVAGAKLVVVMGHTSCGAVMGSCDNVQLGHISSLVDTIQPSVAAVTPEGEKCSSKNAALVNDIASHNVNRNIAQIRERSAILAELESQGAIKIVGAMYDVGSGRVTFM